MLTSCRAVWTNWQVQQRASLSSDYGQQSLTWILLFGVFSRDLVYYFISQISRGDCLFFGSPLAEIKLCGTSDHKDSTFHENSRTAEWHSASSQQFWWLQVDCSCPALSISWQDGKSNHLLRHSEAWEAKYTKYQWMLPWVNNGLCFFQ